MRVNHSRFGRGACLARLRCPPATSQRLRATGRPVDGTAAHKRSRSRGFAAEMPDPPISRPRRHRRPPPPLPPSTACILPCHAAFPHPRYSNQRIADLSPMPHLSWLLAAALLGGALLRPAAACSSFVVDCSDGAVVSARTM